MVCVQCDNRRCIYLAQLPPSQPPDGGPVELSASVGLNGRNLLEDTTSIQTALNDVPEESGRANPLLVVDGVCGSKTKQAIQKFQLQQFGWKLADGRIDPGGPSLERLNELRKKPSAAVAGDSAPKLGFIFDEYKLAIGEAQTLIRAAIRNLDLAISSQITGTQIVPGTDKRMALVQQHFSISALPDVSGQLLRLRSLYHFMLSVFQRSGGLWGWNAFAPYYPGKRGTDSTWVAYTYIGGYYKNGLKENGERADTIYLCQRVDFAGSPQSILANVIVHELAHFVSGGVAGAVEDFQTYGWVDEPAMRRLVPWQRIHHADSMKNFAFAARWGF